MQKTFQAGQDKKLIQHLEKTFSPETDVLRRIRAWMESNGLPAIQVGPFDGLHLEILARACGARKIVEIGTLGGYSGTRLASALPEGGMLHTFELMPEFAEVARKSFEMAGVASKVRVHVGEALANLPKIELEGPFDLVFIDADKTSYPRYLEWAERNLRVGGLIVGDNTFAFGDLALEAFDDPEREATVRAIREFNSRVASGGRFRGTILPTGEGLTVGVKVR